MSTPTPETTEPTVPQLIQAVKDARGCGCCSYYGNLPDSCPTEDGWTDHTYDDGCSADFDSLLRRLVSAVRKEVAG